MERKGRQVTEYPAGSIRRWRPGWLSDRLRDAP